MNLPAGLHTVGMQGGSKYAVKKNVCMYQNRPILFFVLHPENFSRGGSNSPEAKRLGLWWCKNDQKDAQKKKISLDLLVLLDQAKRTNRKILRIILSEQMKR